MWDTQPRRRRHKSPLPGCLLASALILAAVLFAGWLVIAVPAQVENQFGPPAASLGLIQRLRLTADLALHSAELSSPGTPGGEKQTFVIRLGESVGSISGRLYDAGLVRNAGIFREYLVYKGYDTQLQAGKFELSPTLSMVAVAQAMLDATPTEVTFGVLPGWRLEEIAAALPTSGMSITGQEFIQAAHNLDLVPELKRDLPEQASLEGFLFPGTYSIPRGASTGELIAKLTSRFTQEVTPEMRAAFQKNGLSLYQAVTLASIVQKEAVLEEEQPLIASVFYNRMAAGMKLDSDPTVQYALAFNQAQSTWWTNPLTAADLQVDSPYNTYAVTGLPPGPIANPGISALQAVAFPAKSQFYYFRARCDGSHLHVFAATLDEQVKNACQP